MHGGLGKPGQPQTTGGMCACYVDMDCEVDVDRLAAGKAKHCAELWVTLKKDEAVALWWVNVLAASAPAVPGSRPLRWRAAGA